MKRRLIILGMLLVASLIGGGGMSVGHASRVPGHSSIAALRLIIKPNPVPLGRRIVVILTGVNPNERVRFAAHPVTAGFGGGLMGTHRAGKKGTILFNYQAFTQRWELGTWFITAQRPNGTMLQTRLRVIARPKPASAPPLSPREMITQYFGDIKAHRYHAAYLLEVTCSATFQMTNGNGAAGSMGLPGRGVYHGIPDRGVIRSLRITSIRPFHDRLLHRLHFLGFRVNGWFRFVYPPVGSGYAGNNERASGFHRIAIIVRRCGGVWGIDPNWWDTGGPWNWT